MGEIPRGIPEEETNFKTPLEKRQETYESQQETVARFSAQAQQQAEIKRQFGREGLLHLRKMIDAELAGEDAGEEVRQSRELLDYDKIGRQVFEEMRASGAVEEVGPGQVIVDAEKLRNLVLTASWRNQKSGFTRLEAKYLALRDYLGIERSQYEKGDREFSPVFYLPKNEREAFDLNAIKQSKFVMPLWEAGQQVSEGKILHPSTKGPGLNFRAVEFAVRLYHPRYGDAVRDKRGKLLMRDPKTRQYRPVTAELMGRRQNNLSHKFAYDVGEFLENETPELLKYKLLKRTDFRTVTSGEFKSQRLLRKEVSPDARGMVMINGVLHYVGRARGGKAEVVQLQPGTGGILEKDQEGRDQLTQTFRIYEKQDLPEELTKDPNPTAKKKKTNVTAFEPEVFLPKRNGEDNPTYRERIAPLLHFSEYWEFLEEVNQQAGLRLSDMPLGEQVDFSAAAMKYPERRDELISFAKKFGVDGIKAFTATEQGLEYADRILRIAQLPQEQAQEIFAEFNRVTGAAGTEQEKGAALKKIEEEKTQVVLLKKIMNLLPRDAVAGLDLRDMPAITRIEHIRATELAREEHENIRKQMKSSIDKQFPAGDGDVFINEILKNERIRFTITVADGQVLSFFSKEEIAPNVEYIDWFICNPDTKIKGLSEATLRLGLGVEQTKDQGYYAVLKPHVKSHYIFIEKMGFVGFGGATADGEYKHHYARSRRLPVDTELKSKNLGRESEQEFRKMIVSQCQADGELKSIIYGGTAFDAVKVTYHGQTALDDIRPEDPDGWVFGEITRQYGLGKVLARFIPASPDKNNQTFYAVFEKDPANEETKRHLMAAITHSPAEAPTVSEKTREASAR